MTTENIIIDTTDLQSIADAIAAGITTPELMAEYLSLELNDGVLVFDDDIIFADDGNAEVEYLGMTAKEAAKEYVETGSWEHDSTIWIRVRTYRNGVNSEGTIVEVDTEWHTITLDVPEPSCTDDGEHVWHAPYSLLGGLRENPGVWGNGGGAIIKEICRCCGCERITDTWAQNPETGEQGLTSVAYKEGEHAAEMTKRAIARAKERLGTGTESTDGYDFCWINESGQTVGCSEDDLLAYGIELARDPEAETIAGTPIED